MEKKTFSADKKVFPQMKEDKVGGKSLKTRGRIR